MKENKFFNTLFIGNICFCFGEMFRYLSSRNFLNSSLNLGYQILPVISKMKIDESLSFSKVWLNNDEPVIL